jgi:tripartite-type tricarboxylate transporter receptor subunit TctC
MKRVQDSSAMQERLVAMGLESVYLIPNEFAEHIKFEIEKW